MRLILRIVALTAAFGSRAAAQELPCSEFPVNEYTTGAQTTPSVASAPNGDFVVVWSSNSDIVGRRYDASGQPRGPEFLVNTYTSGSQVNPDVAVDGGGGFVVVWNGQGTGDDSGIFGQRYDPSGTPQGGEFQVNTSVTHTQGNAAVATDPAGGFVVSWDRYNYPGPWGVFGQRYDATGMRQGAEFEVNTTSVSTEARPAVGVDAAGGFLIVWHRNFFGGSQGVMGRRFGADGAPLGAEFHIDTGSDSGLYPEVAHGPNGDFVVVWGRPSVGVIVGRRLDSAGTPQGASFPISDATGGAERPVIAGGGQDYVVAWNRRVAGPDFDVLGHRLGASAVPFGSDFRINSYTTSTQFGVSVARTSNGGFVALWRSDGQDGDDTGVIGSLDCARLYTVSPCRVTDTREPPGTPLAANSARTFAVTGTCGIPADARAVAVNATAVNPTDFGNLRLYPAGTAAPLASSLNFAAGLTRANNAIVPLGADGQIAVQCDMPPGSSGATHFVLDVYGYFKR
jgi:hypothetical protein